MTKITLVAMVTLVAVSFSSAAWAVDWYVDASDGNDANPPAAVHTDFGTAYRTIGQAVADAAAGDVIYVNSGTYGEYVYTDKDLSIIGVGNVLIDGNSRYRQGIAVNAYVTTFSVTNLIFQNCSTGLYLSGGSSGTTNGRGNVTIERCIFRNNSSGLSVLYDFTALVRNSLFYDNGYGIYTYQYPYDIPEVNMWYCTLSDNGVGAYANIDAARLYFNYSLFSNNTTGISAARPPAANKVSHCDFWGGTISSPVLPIGPDFEPNYALDPMFVDRPGRNYYLSPASPLLDLRIKDETGRLATIGALKCGFVSNNAEDNWNGWLDGEGNALTASSKVELFQGAVTLKPLIDAAAIISPVYDSGDNRSKLVRINYQAVEFENEDPGYKSYIDFDLNTPEQEIRYRVSDDMGSMGVWNQTVAGNILEIKGRYYQVEYVLRAAQ